MNFLRRIFAVCHSFRSMYQSGWIKGFERCFKVQDQGTWRRQNLHASIFCDRQRTGYKLTFMSTISSHLGKERSLRILNELKWQKNISPLKDLMWKYLSLAKHIRKLWRLPSDKVLLELVILLNNTQGSFLLTLSLGWLALIRMCAHRLKGNWPFAGSGHMVRNKLHWRSGTS